MGRIVFYEGNGASQDVVHTVDDSPGQNFKPKHNDEARSVKLLDVRPGCVIGVYDHTDASTNDDFCIIVVKSRVAEYTVETFERSYENETVRVSYARKNGLDGKVSRITID